MSTISTRTGAGLGQPEKRLSLALLVYALPLFLSAYGLKCIATSHGILTVASRWLMGGFRLVHVHGSAAILAGVGYVVLALFGALSVGEPPPENRAWPWRVVRAVIRWGSLAGAFWSWERANELIHLSTPLPTIRSTDDLTALMLVMSCFGTVAVLCFLWAMFQREAVKWDLREKRCKPLHIWWRPAAYWAPFLRQAAPFRVIYRDSAGFLHKAYCCAYHSFEHFPNWCSRRVRWLADEAVGKP